MKKLNYLVAVAAVALGVTLSAQAGEPLLSPKAKEQAYSLRKGPGTTPDMIDRSIQPGTPKGRELAYSLRKVPSAGPDIDLAHAPRPTLAPKDPRFEAAWRANAESAYQFVPVK